jgi:Concanavalin A-like lectin/glucanases superfamily
MIMRPLLILLLTLCLGQTLLTAQDDSTINYDATRFLKLRVGESNNARLVVDPPDTSTMFTISPVAIDSYILTNLTPGKTYTLTIEKVGGSSGSGGFSVTDRVLDTVVYNTTSYKGNIVPIQATYGPIEIVFNGGLTPALLQFASACDYRITLQTPDAPTFLVAQLHDGMLIKSEESTSYTVYLIEDGTLRPFPSAYHFNSWYFSHWDRIVLVSASVIANTPTGAVMPFKDGTLVKYSDRPSDRTVFLIHRGVRRPFTSWADFIAFGHAASDIMSVPGHVLDSVGTGVALVYTQGVGVLVLTAVCSPSSAGPITAGNSQQFVISASGGTPPYKSTWSSTGGTPTTGTGSTFVPAFPTMGSFVVTGTVTDSGSLSAGLQQTKADSCSITVNGASVPSGPAALSQSSLFSDPSLIAYYPFEGNSNDSKGSHNGAGTNITYGTSYGKFGQGANFDGSSSFISLGSSVNIPAAFSIHAWVYLKSPLQTGTVFNNDNSGGTQTVYIQINGQGSMSCSNFISSIDSPNGTLTAGAWYMIDYTNDGSSAKLYINGSQVAAGTVAHTAYTESAYIGKYALGTNYLKGSVDDYAIFSRALSGAEIASVYRGGGTSPPPTTGTISVSVSGYSGNITCSLNGQSLTAPTTLSNQPPGSYTLAYCTAPSGYALSITPAATQTVAAGLITSFVINLTKTSNPISINSCSANVVSALVGQSPTWTASYSGGIGTLTGTWSLAGGSPSTGTGSSFTSTMNSVGSYTPLLTVTDTTGTSHQANCSTVTAAAAPPLTGSCTVNGSTNAQSLSVGSNIVWNANVSGGTAPLNFGWYGVSTGSSAQSVVLVPTSAATFNASVVVNDSGSPKQQITLSCPQVTVTASPTLGCGCSLSPNPINLGSGSTLSASCVGGSSPYQFQLPNSSGFSNNSALMMPSSRGTQSYTITGKDSAGRTASGSCSLTVN